MKKTVDFTSFARCFVLALFVIFSTPCWAQSAYYTGDGGKGIRLAVLEPTGKGLSAQEQWMLSLIQGSITGDFNKYSAITVIDRQNLEKILAEQKQLMSGNYSDSDYVRLGQFTNSRYILAGAVSKTANNYMLELSVSDAENGERKASYPPKPVSLLALENLSEIMEKNGAIRHSKGIQMRNEELEMKMIGGL
jgi:TolB-like protein